MKRVSRMKEYYENTAIKSMVLVHCAGAQGHVAFQLAGSERTDVADRCFDFHKYEETY